MASIDTHILDIHKIMVCHIAYVHWGRN